MDLLLIYLLTVNAVSFLLMLADKRRAIKKQWRIPEATLLTSAAIGGSLGCMLSMRVFRHKTKHLKFSLGVPLLFVLHLILLFYIFIKFSV